MRWFRIALFGLAFGCGGASIGEGSSDPDGREGARAAEPEIVVEVHEVARGSVADVLVSSAIVEAEAQADLFPEATGAVVEVRREEGDAVRKGEILAVLDNVTLDAGAERAAADLERVRRDYERVRTLHAQGAVSERELTEAKFQYDAARTSSREASRTQGQTRITAPFDGVVAARDIRIGELATGGKRAFQVVDLSVLRVVASLPERDLARVALGQRARLVSAYDPSVWSEGEVVRIAPVVDATSGTFRVTLGIAPGQSALRPGQYVSVQLEVDRHEGVVVVPRKGLLYEDGVPIAYVMVPAPDVPEDDARDEKKAKGWRFGAPKSEEGAPEDLGPRFVAERRILQTGLIDTDWVEVEAGVAPGEPIVVVGQSNLKAGARVLTAAMKAERDATRAARRDQDASTPEPSGSEG